MVKWTGTTTPADYDFTRIGITPVTFQLPPGTYLLEAEGPDVSRGSRLLEMRGVPKRLVVNTGSEGLGTAGTLMTAIGATGILTGIVLLTGVTDADAGLDKTTTSIPFLAGGAALLGAGIGFYVMSRTTVEEGPSGQRSPPPPAARAWTAGVRFRF